MKGGFLRPDDLGKRSNKGLKRGVREEVPRQKHAWGPGNGQKRGVGSKRGVRIQRAGRSVVWRVGADFSVKSL